MTKIQTFYGQRCSNYLIFVDESGDAVLGNYTKTYPMFVLAFVIISKDEYCNNLLPKFSSLKLKYFPDANTIFHEREIRKAENRFKILTNSEIRNSFMSDMNELMQAIDYKVIAVAVKKDVKDEKLSENLYELCVERGLQKISEFLQSQNDLNYTTITFEARGGSEDRTLRQYFAQFETNNFGIDIHSKSAGGLGLQFADLVARPIGNNILHPEQDNRAWEIIREKICNNGLTVLPE